MSLSLMTAPLGRFWSEGRETICCGAAAGECRLKTVVYAVERRWRLGREREAYDIQEFCRSARPARMCFSMVFKLFQFFMCDDMSSVNH
jgi:hypothetical protein